MTDMAARKLAEAIAAGWEPAHWRDNREPCLWCGTPWRDNGTGRQILVHGDRCLFQRALTVLDGSEVELLA